VAVRTDWITYLESVATNERPGTSPGLLAVTNSLRGAIFLFRHCGLFAGRWPVVVSVGPAPQGAGRDENARAYSPDLKLSEGKFVIDFLQ
jgi:hypothetical protein